MTIEEKREALVQIPPAAWKALEEVARSHTNTNSHDPRGASKAFNDWLHTQYVTSLEVNQNVR